MIIEVHTLMARVAQDLAVECCFISWVLWSRSLNIHILSCVDKNNSVCHSNNSQMVSSLTITIFTRDIHHQIAYLYSVFFFNIYSPFEFPWVWSLVGPVFELAVEPCPRAQSNES